VRRHSHRCAAHGAPGARRITAWNDGTRKAPQSLPAFS
jgi:hypothetical protein